MTRARAATDVDASAVAKIYNEGIEDGIATFETRPRTAEEIRAWFDGRHPIVVVEDAGGIVAFAATSTYRPRDCYAGVAEFSVYVARAHRGRGFGRAAMHASSSGRGRPDSGSSCRACSPRTTRAWDC